MSSNIGQSMSTNDMDDMFAALGDGIGDPTARPPPIVLIGLEAAHTSEQPITSMGPQSQDVGHMQPGPVYSQVAYSQLYSQGQNRPIDHHVANAVSDPAAPPQPYNNVTAQQVQDLGLFRHLPDGIPSYQLPAPTTVKTKKRRCVKQQQEGPYVKKPLNAFMIFLKEQRPQYAVQVTSGGSAVINGLLGQKWKSLSKDEQAKYYQQADVEKLRHAQRHPDWTLSNNYGVKRKRDRPQVVRATQLVKVLASTLEEVSQLAKRLCVASVVVEAPPTNTHEPSKLQTIWLQSPNREASVYVYDDIESFLLDFNKLKEVKQLNLTTTMRLCP